MAYVQKNIASDTEIADPRWKDLYTIGGICSFIMAMTIICAVIGFFIWPSTPGVASVESIFTTLQVDRLGGLVSLDLPMLVIEVLMIVQTTALYVALKKVNESYALIALVLGLMAIALIIPTRPLVEMAYLSDQYAAAVTETAKSQYMAAGEALLSYFNGTSWMIYTFLTAISGLIYSVLMLRSHIFSKLTGYIGITLTFGIGIFIPVIGVLLSLLATIGSVIWLVLIARRLLQLGRRPQALPDNTHIKM